MLSNHGGGPIRQGRPIRVQRPLQKGGGGVCGQQGRQYCRHSRDDLFILFRSREKGRRDGQSAPQGSVRSRGACACPAVLADMASVAAAGTTAAVVVSMDKEARSNRSGRIYDLHEVRKSKSRMESDGEVYNTIQGIFEEAVAAADSLRDAAKLLEVGANIVGSKAVWDRRYPHGGNGISRGPTEKEANT
jgi:hypothetical protein